jgi:hypothetical protein
MYKANQFRFVHSIIDDVDLFNRQVTARFLVESPIHASAGNGSVPSKDQRSRPRNRAGLLKRDNVFGAATCGRPSQAAGRGPSQACPRVRVRGGR